MHYGQLAALWGLDTLGFEPRAFRMRSGCDTTTPCALESKYAENKEHAKIQRGVVRAAARAAACHIHCCVVRISNLALEGQKQ